MLCVATKLLNLKAIPSQLDDIESDIKLCVATKLLNLKAIPSISAAAPTQAKAVRCNKITKSESYSQWEKYQSELADRCALQQNY
ncbi:hypothetical protein HR17_06055 [Porphyromonas gulae]|nr:hypothetical protein HR17_06055 [Porphyromonas gulae]